MHSICELADLAHLINFIIRCLDMVFHLRVDSFLILHGTVVFHGNLDFNITLFFFFKRHPQYVVPFLCTVDRKQDLVLL